jgi:hypothetical protein
MTRPMGVLQILIRGLTLDLSRAAKRRRLEGLVRLLSAHHAAAYVR